MDGLKLIWTGEGVRVWHANLRDHAEEKLADVLPEDDVRRARSYRDPDFHRRFIVRRALLRVLLSSILDEPAAKIRIAVSPGGKPYLPGSEWDFSTSFSGDEALFAASPVASVGVDIERMDPGFRYESLLAEQFSVRERKELSRLPRDHRRQAFFKAWVRKEACAKATGHGMAVSMARFEVTVRRAEPLEVRLDDGVRLLVFDLPSPLWFLAAVAVRCGATPVGPIVQS